MDIKIVSNQKNTANLEAVLSGKEVDEHKEHAVDEMISSVTVKGFRQGKAPKSIARDHIDPDKLSNHILGHILNDIVIETVKKEKLHLLGRPVLEKIDPTKDKGWSIKLSLPLYPQIEIPDYQKILPKIAKPTKGKAKTKAKTQTQEDKIDTIYTALLKNIPVDIPSSVIEEETNYSLERLVNQAKSLNLSLEKYLQAVHKDLDEVKKEYAQKAEESIKLDLILLEITRKEKIDTPIEEIKTIAKAGNLPEDQIIRLKSIIDRRKTIDLLLTLC